MWWETACILEILILLANMGNKQKTWQEGHRKDPRTKTTRRKRNRGGLVITSETGITSTISDNLDDSASSGPSNSCVITASERKLKLLKDAVSHDTSTAESTAALTEETNDDGEEEEEEEIFQNETEAKAGHYVIIDRGILFPLLNDLVKSPRCGFSVKTNNILQEKQGPDQLIKISCCSISCRWEKSFWSGN